MLDKKPNQKLMAQLRLMVKHADAFAEALRSANIPDPDFPKDELIEHITSLRELPDGIARGVIETIPPIHDRLTDMKLDFLETEDDVELEDADPVAPPKLKRGNNLDQSMDRLLGSMSSALTLVRRQAGTEPPAAHPEIEIQTNDIADVTNVRRGLEIAETELNEQTRKVDGILDDAGLDRTDATRDQLDRTLQYGKTTTRVTKTELNFKTVTKSRLQSLGRALTDVPTLIQNGAKGIEFTASVLKPVWQAWDKWKSSIIEGGFDGVVSAARGVRAAVDEWNIKEGKNNAAKTTALPPIPHVDQNIQEEAEEMAVALLVQGKSVPDKIADNVRRLDFTILDDQKTLESLDMKNLSNFKYLSALYLPFHRGGIETAVQNYSEIGRHQFLEELVLRVSDITTVPALKHPEKLKVLNLWSTRVIDLNPLQHLTALTSLDLNGKNLTDLTPLKNLMELTSLYLGNTRVKDITPLKDLTALTSLSLNGSEVKDLKPLQELRALTMLNLSTSQLEDIAPLKDLAGLTSLNLSGTEVNDLTPLKDLKNLTLLDLQHTKVSDWTPVSHVEDVRGRPDDWEQV